jgi:hypothetical protein
MRALTNNPIYFYLVILFSFIIEFFEIITNNHTFNRDYFLTLIGLFAFYWIFQVVNNQLTLGPVLIITNGLLAHIILNNKLNYRIHYIFFICLCFFFIIAIYRGINLNKIFAGGSRNVVTIILLVNIALLHFVEFINNKRISFIPVLLFFYISIVAMGRTGILCAFIYLLYIMYYISEQKIWLRVIIIGGVILLGLYFYDSITNLDYFSYLNRRGINYTEDSRMEFLSVYLKNIDAKTFIFGYNYEHDAYFQRLSNNPHNSFINMHSHVGIFILPFLLFIGFRLLKYIKINKLFFVLIVLIMLRAWNDTMFFFGFYDFIFYSLLIYKSKGICK